MGSPLRKAPPPFTAENSSPAKGSSTMPSMPTPSFTSPTEMEEGPVAPDEVGGAVDGVNHPVPAGGHLVFLLLLGEEVGLGSRGERCSIKNRWEAMSASVTKLAWPSLVYTWGRGMERISSPACFTMGNGLLGQLFQFHVVSLPFRPIIARRGTCRKLVRILLRNL